MLQYLCYIIFVMLSSTIQPSIWTAPGAAHETEAIGPPRPAIEPWPAGSGR